MAVFLLHLAVLSGTFSEKLIVFFCLCYSQARKAVVICACTNEANMLRSWLITEDFEVNGIFAGGGAGVITVKREYRIVFYKTCY